MKLAAVAKMGGRRVALPLLLLVIAACGAPHRSRPPLAEAGGIRVTSGWAYPTTGGAGVAYLELEETGPAADTLVAVEGEGRPGMLMRTVAGRMEMLEVLAVPAGTRVRMWPGGDHVMFDGLPAERGIGDTMALTLRFARAGPVAVRVPVVAYGELPD